MMLRVYYLIGLFVALDAVHVVPVHLVSEANTRYRTRRDVPDESMPDRLTFQMNFLDKPVTLRLRQSELLDVTTSDPRTTLLGNQFITDSAVYTDPSLSSAVIVRRNNGQYNLAGTFNAFGYSWDIEPHEGEASTGNSQLHKIFSSPRLDRQLNLGDDAIHVKKADDPERKEPVKYTTYDQHPGERSKRAFTHHVVEMAFIIEYQEYLNWTLLYGDIEGMSQLRLWYSFVAEGINSIYQDINDTDISISTSVTTLKVLTTPKENYFLDGAIDNGIIGQQLAVDILSSWVQRQIPNNLTESDHYMLFSRKNLLGKTTLGLANIGKTCTTKGVSIITTRRRDEIPTAAAHELAHSLGALHDRDTGDSSCISSDEFIMTWFFNYHYSKCSINSMKSYLSKVNCTRPENTIAKNIFPTPDAGQRAGETYTKDKQCEIYVHDKLSKYCPDDSTGVDKKVCNSLRCCKLNSNNTCSNICPSVRPLDYTSCGDNKACYRGLCIAL